MFETVIPDDAALGQTVQNELAGVVVRVAAAIVLELILDQHLSPFKRALWPPGAGLPGDAVCPVGFYGAVDLDVRPPLNWFIEGGTPTNTSLICRPVIASSSSGPCRMGAHFSVTTVGAMCSTRPTAVPW